MKISLGQGTLQGIKNISQLSGKPYYSFLRIPYAKPPVNLLRFQAPQPHEGWSGILDATQNTTCCPQQDRFHVPPFVGEEDCLYLNVHIPEDPHATRQLKPVMVYIHGGGFSNGSGNMYRADYLINYDIIFVTVNYRLNVFGFLNLDLANCPGNVGLKDQVMAFQWVRKNIAAFGGDPKNVTAFGESAGGASIHYLMICPSAHGLFDKAIIQSGSALCSWSFTEKKIEYAFRLGNILGCYTADKQELFHFLLEVSAEDIIQAQAKLMNELGKNDIIRLPFVPSVEDRLGQDILVPAHPKRLLKNIAKIPLVTGVNDLEGLIFLFGKPISKLSWLNDNFNVIPDDILAFKNRYPQIEKKIKEFYLDGQPIGSETLPQFVDLLSDVGFTNSFYDVIRPIVESGPVPPVFLYKFSYVGSFNYLKQWIMLECPEANLDGPCHGDDLFYLFIVKMGPDFVNEGEEKFIDMMCRSWTNFAKFGTPASASMPWQSTSLHQPCYLSINENPEMKFGVIDERRMQFWSNIRRELRLLHSPTDSKL